MAPVFLAPKRKFFLPTPKYLFLLRSSKTPGHRQPKCLPGFDPCRRHSLSTCKCPDVSASHTIISFFSDSREIAAPFRKCHQPTSFSLEEQTIDGAAQKAQLSPTLDPETTSTSSASSVDKCSNVWCQISTFFKWFSFSLREWRHFVCSSYAITFFILSHNLRRASSTNASKSRRTRRTLRGGDHVIQVTYFAQARVAPLAEGVLGLAVPSTVVRRDDPDGPTSLWSRVRCGISRRIGTSVSRIPDTKSGRSILFRSLQSTCRTSIRWFSADGASKTSPEMVTVSNRHW
ncbi:unnamed protein product [Acanthosepion pharaonis]|uniref:Uncharacterized protein n=1 Tax=Acanthosepion pharaonis TaxID=158019 RepID=A0A812E2E9_ACAPH|nr:unnamed protein product [Sepia pharaonis]